MITEETSLILSDTVSPLQRKLFNQIIKDKTIMCPPELKSFALTLNFYSPRANISHVRKTLITALPHQRTIQKWYQSVDCNAGFMKEAFEVLKAKVDDMNKKGKRCICALMMDEMSIHSKVEWDGDRFIGCVDFGNEANNNEDNTPEANEALVFMINCVNDSWKLPIGFFLIHAVNGVQKSNLISTSLMMLLDVGVEVCSITFDGASSNISAAADLGVPFSTTEKTDFPHPISGAPVFILLDPPHMIKLVRNSFGTCKIFYDFENNAIKWELLEELVAIQEKEGLHPGTKITRRHLNWQCEKMKVKLAAQTLSKSVAKAIQYLRSTEYSQHFVGSEATEKFVDMINDAFDLLNSRNYLAKGYKKGINENNSSHSFERIEQIIEYILNLKVTPTGNPLCQSQKKTGFVGLVMSLRSVIGIYRAYCEKYQRSGFRFLLTYKLCQDHLEVFFSAIRSRGGHNNNPTVRQFKAAYKRLLMHTAVTGSSNSSCVEDVPVIILSTSSITSKKKLLVEEVNSCSVSQQQHLLDHSYFVNCSTHAQQLSEYVDDIVVYIAGFVVKKLKKNLECEICSGAIAQGHVTGRLIAVKQYDSMSLVQPSTDVIHVCKVTESQIRITNKIGDLNKSNPMLRLVMSVMKGVRRGIFSKYEEHMFDSAIESNHLHNLVGTIVYEYCRVRLHHLSNSMINKDHCRIRSRLTKTILFKNQ